MTSTLSRAHTFVPPPPGHIDGPNACDDCGHGPRAPQHGEVDRVATARTVAEKWLEGLAQVGGNAAFGVVALRAVLAALDGDTDIERLISTHGMRGTITPDRGDRQPPLPLAA